MSADIHLMTKLKFVDMKKSENEVKGGFAVDPRMADWMPFEFRMPLNNGNEPLLRLDKTNTNLDELVTNASVSIGLAKGGSNDYGFLYDQESNRLYDQESNRNVSSAHKSYSFVTDEGLKSLKDGFVLIITASPKNYAKKMLYKLSNIDLFSSPQVPMPIWQSTLETLFNLSQDFTFASEFRKLNDTRKVADIIYSGSFGVNASALCRLFCRAKFENNESLTLSLSILLAILDKGGKLESVVQKKVQFESLIRHLEKKDESILLAVLTLMNLLYNTLDSTEQFSILSLLYIKAFRSGIENVIKLELLKPDDRIKQQLILIQELCFIQ
uniref:ELMO armadillo-like helical domain-containing protein n=1 Tax=Panagrolaimus davidi TaxID=227884 RepID=A0A914QYG5_9BILA